MAALQTLADLANHNPLLAKTSETERRSLHAQTGGNPLLLRWTAGQLGRGSCRTIDDALTFLRSCPAGNDPLEFVFGDLAKDFTVEETRVLVALTYFTLPTKLAHIATVADLNNQATETALRTLANRSLVVPDQEEKAFALVPMVADFLRRKRPEVVADTAIRLEQRAYALIVENGYQQYDRFAVLDAEWPTIVPALPLFIAGPNDRLQTVCNGVRFFCEFTVRWDEWLSLEQQGEARAVKAGDFRSAGWRAFQAGWVHQLRGQANPALACARRTVRYWKRAEVGPREQAAALHLRGLGYELKNDYPAAMGAYRQAMELIRGGAAAGGDIVKLLGALANVEAILGDHETAEQHYREALAMARTDDYAEGVAVSTGNLARLMLTKKEWTAAEKLARKAVRLSEKLGRLELITAYSLYLAEALVWQNKKDKALPHAQRALHLGEQIGVASLINSARLILTLCGAEIVK